MVYFLSVTFRKPILWIIIEIFSELLDYKTGKWCRVLVNFIVCLLTSYPIPNIIFTFALLGVVLKMFEDTKWRNVISVLKQYLPILYFNSLCRIYG